MTIELPRTDFDADGAKGLRRRQVLKAGAWAAPVIVLTAAAPAAQASPGPVPASQLTVTAGALTNTGTGGALGPLAWAGGSIAWSRATPGQPTVAAVSYTVALTGPGGLNTTLLTSAANIPNGGSVPIAALNYGTAPLAAGVYTITLTAVASDGSKSATSSVTLVAPVVGVVTAVGTVNREGQSSRFRLNAAFASTFTTARTLTRNASLDVIPSGVTFASAPAATISVNASGTTQFTPLATITGGAVSQTVRLGYSYPTGGSPSTANVLVTFALV